MNGIVRVEYRKNQEYNYLISVEDNVGTILVKGNIYNKEVRNFFKTIDKDPKWFVDKANETFVYNIMNKEIMADDWGWSCIIEGGCVEDWGECYNL